MEDDPKILLEKVYKTHHQTKGRYGYLFCHGKRAPYLQKWIGKGKKILDLGCRDGQLTQFFSKENTVLGVDIDREALKRAEKALSIETKWLDLNREWPFEENSFDVIVACEILEHLYYPHLFLQRVYKTLKKEGLFIGSVPNSFRIRNRFKFLLGNEFETDKTHVSMFSYFSLQEILQELFSSLQIVPLQGKILPWAPVKENSFFFLKRLFARDLLWCAEKK